MSRKEHVMRLSHAVHRRHRLSIMRTLLEMTGVLVAKTCTIDGQWSTIGTANLDRLSAVGNYEINAEVYSEALALQMEELFTSDTTNAFELTREQWMSRPWYRKLSERILSPLRAMM